MDAPAMRRQPSPAADNPSASHGFQRTLLSTIFPAFVEAAPDQAACQSDRDGSVSWSHGIDQQLFVTQSDAQNRAHLE
jgi:hypothetical protein